jgi:hypothetical protein
VWKTWTWTFLKKKFISCTHEFIYFIFSFIR